MEWSESTWECSGQCLGWYPDSESTAGWQAESCWAAAATGHASSPGGVSVGHWSLQPDRQGVAEASVKNPGNSWFLWQQGKYRFPFASMNRSITLIRKAMFKRNVVRTFISPCSLCERLTFITVSGSWNEFVNHRSTLSASLCFIWNRLEKSTSAPLQLPES